MPTKLLRLLAFRYALGRRTYVTAEMTEELIKNWDEMIGFHYQIQDDIRRAITLDIAGDDCDIKEWEKVLKLEPELPAPLQVNTT